MYAEDGMDIEILYRLIIRQNPWWADGVVQSAQLPKRNLFDEISTRLYDRFILSITGPRRVGKTTLIYHLIHTLLEKGVDKNHILYLSFDELFTREEDIIETILELYRNRVLRKSWGRQNVFVFLDEIQYIPFWQAILKRFYDLRIKIKFIVSGSFSTEIQKGKESLAGRLFDFHLLYLDFNDFLKIKGFDMKYLSLKSGTSEIEESYHKILLHETEIKDNFYQYLAGGGFPELLEIPSIEDKQEYIMNAVVDKVIFKDLPQALAVKDIRLLMELLTFSAAYSCQLFEIIQLSKHFKVSRETISNYIEYLKKGYLVGTASNYSASMIRGARTNKKIYVRDTGLRHALMRYSEKDINNPDISALSIETLFYNLFKAHYNDVWFWRDAAGHEVDLVVRIGETILPIEIKYRTSIPARSISGLLYFMDKFKVSTGWMVTPNTFRTEKHDRKSIHLIPAWFAATIINRIETA